MVVLIYPGGYAMGYVMFTWAV